MRSNPKVLTALSIALLDNIILLPAHVSICLLHEISQKKQHLTQTSFFGLKKRGQEQLDIVL